MNHDPKRWLSTQNISTRIYMDLNDHTWDLIFQYVFYPLISDFCISIGIIPPILLPYSRPSIPDGCTSPTASKSGDWSGPVLRESYRSSSGRHMAVSEPSAWAASDMSASSSVTHPTAHDHMGPSAANREIKPWRVEGRGQCFGKEVEKRGTTREDGPECPSTED